MTLLLLLGNSNSSDFRFFNELGALRPTPPSTGIDGITSLSSSSSVSSRLLFRDGVCGGLGGNIFSSGAEKVSGTRILWQVKLRLSLLPRSKDRRFDDKCSKKISSKRKFTSFLVGWTLTSTFCGGNLLEGMRKRVDDKRDETVYLLDREIDEWMSMFW